MAHDLIRNNHYVPIWYQKNFLSSNKGAFHYLNLYPEQIKLPSGEIRYKNQVLWPFSPKQCFYQTDLYTTSFFGVLNDEIERYLFGDIDSYGALSIKALVENDLRLLHKYFKNFFEYLDIQKIRTVKGLAWLRLKYPAISHNVLLIEMQKIRRLHCTIWAETVKEIVSAKNSEIKFIVSDHPVTLYNPACPPDSPDCRYPNDPRIDMKGTQTIFPLNSDQCLILTNLDYAKNPELRDLKSLRPNPNPFRETLVRIDNIINTRELSEEEVAHINRIIKLRAAKFLAAEKKEWLFPEKVITSNWLKSSKILMPAKDQLFHYGGEVYVGYKDGSTSYFDQYGRTTPEFKLLQKKVRTEKIGRNDPCPCGSGKKYKKCCIGKPIDERTSSDVLSIRERNLLFYDVITKLLGCKKYKTFDWDEIRRNLTNSKIAEIHEVLSDIWPPDTDLFALLPRPDKNVFRALYTGLIDPRVTYANIACFSFYADEIFVQSPFINANNLKKEFSPIENPSQYRSETIKNLLFLFIIMPWVETGLVNLFPDPWHFNHSLMTAVMEAATKRKDSIKFDEKDYQRMQNVFFEDHKRNTLALPDNVLKDIFRKSSPDITEDDLDKVIEYKKKIRSQDPLADLNPEYGEKLGQMMVGRITPNLEMSIFLAQASGSMIITDNSLRWSEICKSIPLYYQTSQSSWSAVESFLSDIPVKIPFIINNPDLSKQLTRPEFTQTKNHLRYIWNAVAESKSLNDPQIELLKRNFILAQEEISQAFQVFENQFSGLQKPKLVDAKLNCKIAPIGHINNLVYRLLMSFAGHEKYLKSLPLSLYIEFSNRD